MILIADSGSTKTHWAVLRGTDKEPLRVTTQGMNPLNFTDAELDSVLRRELCGQLTGQRVGCREVSGVAFYGAGCTTEQSPRMATCIQKVFPVARVSVESDLLGAARAVLGHVAGIACILGTGANSCVYDGGRIAGHIPPLGYILGDEGSGAVLGRNFLNGILKGWLPAALRDEFLAETGQSYADIIARVYRQPLANRYLASIAPFVLRHVGEPSVRQLVADNFEAFFRFNVLRYQSPLRQLACVGGVAYHFKDILSEVAQSHGFQLVRVLESPIEGLMEYHAE